MSPAHPQKPLILFSTLINIQTDLNPMECVPFERPSNRKGCTLACYKWLPDGEVRATLQIAHGMTEYVKRYSEMAEILCGLGFAVYGHDHLGHGRTADGDYGYIDDSNGDQTLVGDFATVAETVREENPDVPHFVFGHSMGSFIVRRYITMYGRGIDGAIIMGTGTPPGAGVSLGRTIANMNIRLKGGRSVSKMLNKMVFGTYDSSFKDSKVKNRWLNRNLEEVKKYNADEICGFPFTNGGFRDLFTLIRRCSRKEGIEDIPKDLPLLFLSGDADPVGSFGKGVAKAVRGYTDAGLQPKVIMYPGARHELINELCKDQVFRDMQEWLLTQMGTDIQ